MNPSSDIDWSSQPPGPEMITAGTFSGTITDDGSQNERNIRPVPRLTPAAALNPVKTDIDARIDPVRFGPV
jgi:hypothetical protein